MTDILNQETLELEEDTLKGKFLTFSVGNEFYGIEIKYITEIIGIQGISEVPELPEYIKGVINLRGKIIPVMDVRLRFKKQPIEYNERTCIIVVEMENMIIGLIVDEVSDVISIDDENLVPPPEINRGFGKRYIKCIGKVGKDIKLILDCEKLLNDDDSKKLINL